MNPRQQDVAAVVGAFMRAAAQALHANDRDAFVRSLADAVRAYERNPSCAQARTTHLQNIIVFIRTACTVYQRFGRPADELLKLAVRAEALTKSIH
jgi:hypothetical protein